MSRMPQVPCQIKHGYGQYPTLVQRLDLYTDEARIFSRGAKVYLSEEFEKEIEVLLHYTSKFITL